MVDHRSRHFGQYLCGYRSRAGDAQVLRWNGSARLHLWHGDSFSFVDRHGCVSQSILVLFIDLAAVIIVPGRKKRGGQLLRYPPLCSITLLGQYSIGGGDVKPIISTDSTDDKNSCHNVPHWLIAK